MRPALIAMAVAAGFGYGSLQAVAADQSVIKVDHFYRDGKIVHALMRVTNVAKDQLPVVQVSCDVFAADGSALGIASTTILNVAPGATVIGDALAVLPPNAEEPSSLHCRPL